MDYPNILFLDDDPARHAKFWAREENFESIRVWNAADCIDVLKSKIPWDIVSLDHDLQNEPYQNPDEKNTGSEVCRWICENKPKISKVIIHSYNDREQKRMVDSLIAAGYDAEWIPFNY